jgi:molybdate transport system regulatory protein
VWVVFGPRLKLGDGRARLLDAIDTKGSLRQAASQFGMSYRNAWGYLQQLERAAGFRFVERTAGGGPGAGMRLTAAGREFLARYRQFRSGVEAVAERNFARAFKGTSFTSRSRSPARSARAKAAAR